MRSPRDQMQKQDGEIAHGTIVARSQRPRIARDFAIGLALAEDLSWVATRKEAACRFVLVS